MGKLFFTNSLILAIIIVVGCSKDPVTTNIPENPVVVVKDTTVNTANIAGLNWADRRDNFVDGWVIPSGLVADDNYNTVASKTEAILDGFSAAAPGVNTIRIPINPPSALESWWGNYNAVIDKATSKGWKVIISCWEGASSKDGLIDDTDKFWQMWDVVINKYNDNDKVFIEVFNEPHGYALSSLTSMYAQFLKRYPNLKRGRIILDGTGYAENVTEVGADSRFVSCLLGLHNYAFWASRNSAGAWRTDWRNRIGSYANRTVITEWGAAMSTGKDYQNGNQSDNEIGYIVATSEVCREDKIASVYWPGLRDGDSYSLFTRGGSGTNITLNTVNSSGIFRLRYGWGL